MDPFRNEHARVVSAKGADVDSWQYSCSTRCLLITLILTGSRATQDLPSSTDACAWLRRYQLEVVGIGPPLGVRQCRDRQVPTRRVLGPVHQGTTTRHQRSPIPGVAAARPISESHLSPIPEIEEIVLVAGHHALLSEV